MVLGCVTCLRYALYVWYSGCGRMSCVVVSFGSSRSVSVTLNKVIISQLELGPPVAWWQLQDRLEVFRQNHIGDDGSEPNLDRNDPTV